MSYISEIRKKVGHDRIISVACGIILENEKNEILLQFRKDTKNFGIPGGNIELGETLMEALIREIREETGIELNQKDVSLFGIYSGEKTVTIYPNKDEVQYINVIFSSKISSNVMMKNQEEEALFLQFYSKDHLPSPIKETDQFWISDYIQGGSPVIVK